MRSLLASLPLLALLGGCSYLPNWAQMPAVTGDKVLGLVTPYRPEVVQGNVLTKEMVARVKPGMPKAQVRDLLGSPLLTDVFHESCWDYVFTINRQGATPQKRLVVAQFDGVVSCDEAGGRGFSSASPQSGPIMLTRSSPSHTEWGEGPNMAKPVEVVGSATVGPEAMSAGSSPGTSDSSSVSTRARSLRVSRSFFTR